MTIETRLLSHSAHWGAFRAQMQADGSLVVRPHPADPDPNPIIDNFPAALRHRARVTRPMVRRGWLERGSGPDATRGTDSFVAMEWDEVLDRLADELRRVNATYGADAVFGGSYGWASAGRFHHAQSQLHRFLNTTFGGYVRSVNSYSAGAAEVILPHVLCRLQDVATCVTWDQIVQHTDVVLAFGGMALKNSRIAAGGTSRHIERDAMRSAAARGCRFVCVSPQKTDLPIEADAKWLPITPGTDTAMMLSLVHTLVARGLHDQDFIERYCDGWKTFVDYLLGVTDGIAKSARWAAAICGVPESALLELAESLAGKRVLVTMAHSLQRAEHGEQPVWMGAVLSAALGQIGLPGGGFGYALGTFSQYGRRANIVSPSSLPQGVNRVKDFIPVARIADMLLSPGERFTYDGQVRRYPHIRLAYWAGGNPFHHHQDLKRLTHAFAQLDTLVVHESGWTATARHADIVLPCTMSLEREDIAATPTDPLILAMHRVADPISMARDDYEIFSDLADRLDRGEAFSEGRTSSEWLRHLYDQTRTALREKGVSAPAFDEFWAQGEVSVPQIQDTGGVLRAFRQDPINAPLPTPSGKIQISSPTIAGFQHFDCPAHPAWIEPRHSPSTEWPLWLVANQPAARLHSQLDFGGHSQSTKRDGREVCTMHPATAAHRGIADGDIVRIFNEIGACLASVRLSTDMLENVVQLPTGAWYDPVLDEQGRSMCSHGNPNVLTRDIGTSSLAQGTCGQLSTVQVERYAGTLPRIRAYDPPLEKPNERVRL